MDTLDEAEHCFPQHNSSCRRRTPPSTLLYMVFSSIALLTVVLNLLVIISISHFRQLHSPTNTILLSLAVGDLLVGLLGMPIESLRYMESCWLLGTLLCALTPYFSYCLCSISVGNLVLISIDRYVAICDPLHYSTKITVTRVKICICLCWVVTLLYNGLILMDHLKQPDRFSSCYGDCVVVISHLSGIIDLVFTFIGPCTVIVVLYMRVFLVAVSQARVIQVHYGVASSSLVAKRSERKAARTLGIVIVVFLVCFCPYYYPSLAGEDTSNNLSYFAVLSWIMLTNSCINPLIYAIFYPWFRKAIKFIFTLRVLQPSSRETNIL
ncbi:trace amine-associated receptor 13c-like [Lampris incognitus]|uniref:trace amine-associated receptor 13c-like n=1 Tax=Lampris incognitus TaxID=2546036 RepID=UPI0024B5DF56|nr:trace amine-associated receptor 13c-like [Lampris incognitus]